MERSAAVRDHARRLGFDLVGIAPPMAGIAHERYAAAMAQGYGAEMDWLKDNPQVRSDVREVHPSARAVVMLGVSYWSDTPGYLEAPPQEGEGWIARYAQGKDYHVVLRRRLIQLVKAFEADECLGFPSVAHRIFVDTGPVLEKAFAQRAGLGWIGKNTLLLNQKLGSWLFLATPGPSWPLLALPGPSWLLLAPPGSSRPLLAPPGSSWLLLSFSGSSWLFLAPRHGSGAAAVSGVAPLYYENNDCHWTQSAT